MIRLANAADKIAVIRLLEKSRLAAGFDKPGGFSFTFDPAYAERLFLLHLLPHRLCMVHEVDDAPRGVLMAVAHEHPFGAVKIARETMWFIEREYRGSAAVKMLHGYEAWAHSEGCQFVGMAGMGEDPEVGRLYLRRGYQVAETHYLKAI
jgi:hypothetical protein